MPHPAAPAAKEPATYRPQGVPASRGTSGCSEGPAVWLPWCVAPLWVFLPIVGCLLAGAVRRPAVASGPPQPADVATQAADLMTVGLVPIPLGQQNGQP